jgi:hypothetical protein
MHVPVNGAQKGSELKSDGFDTLRLSNAGVVIERRSKKRSTLNFQRRTLKFTNPRRGPDYFAARRYFSNHSSVRWIASIWFSRFWKPWPSLA